MKLTHNNAVYTLRFIIVSILTSVLASCSNVGPLAISSGRLTYNDAIITTENQQILMVAVHNRYKERGHLLSVASVTANVSISTSAGFQVGLGLGNSSDYAGNLVPFTAGAVYEENPTISYVPVGGEQYSQQLFSPIAVTAFAQLAGSVNNPTGIYLSLISSINGIYNPDFLLPEMEIDPRFLRIVKIMEKLTQAHRLQWVQDVQKNNLFVTIDRSDGAFKTEINELIGLLGLTNIKTNSKPLIIPVSSDIYLPGENIITIKTRSVWGMIELLSAAIELSADDLKKGTAATYLAKGFTAKLLHVHVAEKKPENAYVAVPHHDRWFYIDNTDHATKRYFGLLGNLLYATITDSVGGSSAAPVLTVPVSN